MPEENTQQFEKIISLMKRKGFIFQSSEIYGGLSAVYDYGPLGVLLKNNIQNEWWKAMVQKRDDIVGIDAAILMHPMVWKASGHVDSFSDPLVDCKKCNLRHRVDHILTNKGIDADDKMSLEELESLIKENNIVCPECGGELTKPRSFNLMLKTYLGPVESDENIVYLRPETAQGIYVNFKNVLDTYRVKIPFGIAQVGKAFRNEITTKQFIFRTREFTQMEMQYFVHPSKADDVYEEWKERRLRWFLDLGIREDRLRFKQHTKLAHYAKDAYDIEYEFPFGWKEVEGLHNRGDFDLSQHIKYSNKDLQYLDPETGEKYIPYIIETSIGLDRTVLTFICNAYEEVEGGRTQTTESVKEVEYVLHLHPKIAPVKAAVLPLVKKEERLLDMARDIAGALREDYITVYDDSGSIGRRYRRQDEIGTPFCITVDFDSLKDNTVTLRDRDTMKQDRVKITEIKDYLKDKIG